MSMRKETDALVGSVDNDTSSSGSRHSYWLWTAPLVCLVVSVLALPPFLQSPSEVLLGHQQTERRYKATQFISFTINTLGGVANKGECEGRQVDPDYEGKPICYLGNSQNVTEDLFHRFAIVQQVINVIRRDMNSDNPEIDHDDSVLKIFMMPEFFMRGPHGAYSTDMIFDKNFPAMLKVSDALRDMVQHADFEHYLFVFGTVIFAAREDGRKFAGAGLPNSTTEMLYWNFAPIFAGGVQVDLFLATKKYISTADFLDRNRLPNPSTDMETHVKYDAVTKELDDLLESRGSTIIRNNILEYDGIRFGIEICLDHRLGSLWTNLQHAPNFKDDKNLVDVLLVTSAGMAIERGPNPIKKGGVAYLSDGEASSAACVRSRHDGAFDSEEVCRHSPGEIKHVPMYDSHDVSSEFVLLSGCYDFLNKTDLLQGYYSIYQTQGCAFTLKTYGIDVFDEFAYYPPSIEIYPVVALP